MADIENAGGGVDDDLVTAEADEMSELGFTCCVACTAAGLLALSLSVALLLLYFLATATTMTLFSVALQALAYAGLLAAGLGLMLGILICCTAADLCLHGDTTGERQKDAPPPLHAAMD